MLIDKFALLDIIEKIKQNIIEDTSEYGGFTYKRVNEDNYEVEGVAQIQDKGKSGVIYVPKEQS
jgi:hypothetical protein